MGKVGRGGSWITSPTHSCGIKGEITEDFLSTSLPAFLSSPGTAAVVEEEGEKFLISATGKKASATYNKRWME